MLAGSFYDCSMIRTAVRNDAAMAVPLILQAIGHIAFVLSGTAEAQETESILKDFFGQEGNRMSYQNTLVMEVVYEASSSRGAESKCFPLSWERTLKDNLAGRGQRP